MALLTGKKILLGVSGGIAAYKSPDLVRRLRDQGAEVQVVLTHSAARMVSPTVFQAVSGQPVRGDLWDAQAEAAMGHIELARWADFVVIAPATAHLMAQLAAGLAPDLLTTLCLATTAPVLLAPAMNHAMWAHAATRANRTLLAARGLRFVGPAEGAQACGESGPGRMSEPADIVAALAALAGMAGGALAGRRVLVTAGPTREPIDPVKPSRPIQTGPTSPATSSSSPTTNPSGKSNFRRTSRPASSTPSSAPWTATTPTALSTATRSPS